jgi:hypothetical protein
VDLIEKQILGSNQLDNYVVDAIATESRINNNLKFQIDCKYLLCVLRCLQGRALSSESKMRQASRGVSRELKFRVFFAPILIIGLLDKK